MSAAAKSMPASKRGRPRIHPPKRPFISDEALMFMFTITPDDHELRWRKNMRPAGSIAGSQIMVGGVRYGLMAIYRRVARLMEQCGERV